MREKQIETKLVMAVRDVGGSSAEKNFFRFFLPPENPVYRE